MTCSLKLKHGFDDDRAERERPNRHCPISMTNLKNGQTTPNKIQSALFVIIYIIEISNGIQLVDVHLVCFGCSMDVAQPCTYLRHRSRNTSLPGKFSPIQIDVIHKEFDQ